MINTNPYIRYLCSLTYFPQRLFPCGIGFQCCFPLCRPGSMVSAGMSCWVQGAPASLLCADFTKEAENGPGNWSSLEATHHFCFFNLAFHELPNAIKSVFLDACVLHGWESFVLLPRLTGCSRTSCTEVWSWWCAITSHKGSIKNRWHSVLLSVAMVKFLLLVANNCSVKACISGKWPCLQAPS